MDDDFMEYDGLHEEMMAEAALEAYNERDEDDFESEEYDDENGGECDCGEDDCGECRSRYDPDGVYSEDGRLIGSTRPWCAHEDYPCCGCGD